MRTLPEGIHGGERMNQQEGHGYHHGRVSAAATLVELTREYFFFTHAILFCFGRFDRDPVFDYVDEKDPDFPVFWLQFDVPIFQGLEADGGDPAWNHRIVAVQRGPSAEALDVFLSSLSGIDRDRGKFYSVLSQMLPVPDGIALSKASVLPSPCPMIEVIVYGLAGNDRTVAFEPARNPPMDLPRVVVLPPEEKSIRLGRAILADHDRPFRSVEERGSSENHDRIPGGC